MEEEGKNDNSQATINTPEKFTDVPLPPVDNEISDVDTADGVYTKNIRGRFSGLKSSRPVGFVKNIFGKIY